MELINATKMVAGYTMGMKPDGRESLVVVVKGTFTIPGSGKVPVLAEEQVPLVEADVFTGEPGFSSTLYESDYAPHKPRCDVLLNGSAYAPGGKPTTEVVVGLRVGEMSKSFKVVGNRVWRREAFGASATNPEPFTVMPVSYDRAFGGIDHTHEDPKKHAAFRANLAGVGFHVNWAKEAIDGKPLPNTEQPGKPIREPSGEYRPMAFGAVARGSLPRASFAGTYDDDWLENRFPFLPDDFDDRYHQSAPEDQQIPYPRGGEEVELSNLILGGSVRFRLPSVEVPVEFTRQGFESERVAAVMDTVLIEPDLSRFLLVWRASIALKRNVFEVPMCVVGRMPNGWYRARRLGKQYYSNLRELVADQAT